MGEVGPSLYVPYLNICRLVVMRVGIVFGSSAYITKQINLERDGKREVITPGRRSAYVISRLVRAFTLIGNREVGA